MIEGHRMTVSELVEVLQALQEEQDDVEVWLSVSYEQVVDAGPGPEDYEVHNAYASGPLMIGGTETNLRFVRKREGPAVELSAIDL